MQTYVILQDKPCSTPFTKGDVVVFNPRGLMGETFAWHKADIESPSLGERWCLGTLEEAVEEGLVAPLDLHTHKATLFDKKGFKVLFGTLVGDKFLYTRPSGSQGCYITSEVEGTNVVAIVGIGKILGQVVPV